MNIMFSQISQLFSYDKSFNFFWISLLCSKKRNQSTMHEKFKILLSLHTNKDIRLLIYTGSIGANGVLGDYASWISVIITILKSRKFQFKVTLFWGSLLSEVTIFLNSPFLNDLTKGYHLDNNGAGTRYECFRLSNSQSEMFQLGDSRTFSRYSSFPPFYDKVVIQVIQMKTSNGSAICTNVYSFKKFLLTR